jgi:hypothetical protein
MTRLRCCVASRGSTAAAPDLDEDPLTEEVSVKVGLVVAGLLWIDPPLMLRTLPWSAAYPMGWLIP